MLLAREIRNFPSYTDMQVAHQKDIDTFPMCFIFGTMPVDEIAQELERKLGTKDLSEVMRSPYGGIIRKSDLDSLENLFAHHDMERKHFYNAYNNLVDSIKSEMSLHEYSYTRDASDTLMALGKSANAFLDVTFAKAWEEAKRCVLKEVA